MAFTQELERRTSVMVQLQPGYTAAAVHFVAATAPAAQVGVTEPHQQIVSQQPQQSVPAIQPAPATTAARYPGNGNYYQGATISEIDESVGSSSTMLSYTTGTVQHTHHPQAVQASPVLVLQGPVHREVTAAVPGAADRHLDNNTSSVSSAVLHQHRQKLRQKALVDSVESKV